MAGWRRLGRAAGAAIGAALRLGATDDGTSRDPADCPAIRRDRRIPLLGVSAMLGCLWRAQDPGQVFLGLSLRLFLYLLLLSLWHMMAVVTRSRAVAADPRWKVLPMGKVAMRGTTNALKSGKKSTRDGAAGGVLMSWQVQVAMCCILTW